MSSTAQAQTLITQIEEAGGPRPRDARRFAEVKRMLASGLYPQGDGDLGAWPLLIVWLIRALAATGAAGGAYVIARGAYEAGGGARKVAQAGTKASAGVMKTAGVVTQALLWGGFAWAAFQLWKKR